MFPFEERYAVGPDLNLCHESQIRQNMLFSHKNNCYKGTTQIIFKNRLLFSLNKAYPFPKLKQKSNRL